MAGVDLLRLDELVDDLCSTPKQLPKFDRFVVCEFRGARDMPARLHQERAHTERADAVLDDEERRLVDHTAGKLTASCREVACEAALHGW